MTGCQDYLPDEPVRPYEELGLPTFSMSKDLVFDIDLGLPGVTYPVKVYTENPFDENGELRSGIQPIYAFFTSDGRYNETVRLSGSYDKLYLACGGIGVPMLMEAIVENGVVRAIASDETRAATHVYTNTVNETVQNELNLGGYKIQKITATNGEGQPVFKRFGTVTSGNETFWGSLHALYNWTATGKPLRNGSESQDSYTVFDPTNDDLNYDKLEFYFNNETGEIKENTHDWISYIGNSPEVVTTKKDVEVDDTDKPLYFKLNKEDKDNKFYFKLDIQNKGTLKIGCLTPPTVDTKFTAKWSSSATFKDITPNLKGLTEITYTLSAGSGGSDDGRYYYDGDDRDGYYLACRQGKDVDVNKIVYVQDAIGNETETTTYTLEIKDYAITCTKQVGADGEIVEQIFGSDDCFFKVIPESLIAYEKKTVQQDVPVPATKAPSSVGNLNYGLPMKKTVDGVETKTEITFYVPDNSSALLTIVFGDKDKALVNVKNITTNTALPVDKEDGVKGIRTYNLEAGNYKITQAATTSIYYMSLENKEIHHSVTTSSTYRAHKNVLDANMQQLLNQLTSELWSGYASKSARKAHFSQIAQDIKDGKTPVYDEANDKDGEGWLTETTYNKRYSQLEQGKKNNVTVTKDGTEVWVTFLAEYNMYSCNTLGYYYYTQADYDDKVTNGLMTAEEYAESLDKYIIFPNCSSNQYTSRNKGKYYQNGQLFDESALPLRTGDRVQLVYKGDGSAHEVLSGQGYTEKFPEGTIIGWFLLYNSFNGWDDKKDMICDGILRYADDGITYNNNPDRTSNLDDYKTRVYYSDKEFNKGYSTSAAPTRAASNTEIERVVQITEPGGIAICFEDSYDATDGYDDMTYDDLIIAVTASEPLENNSGNTSQVNPTSTEFNEYGTYLFEDILDGNATDFDMNDVVVEYDRTYTITTAAEAGNDDKYPVTLSKVVEKYTVKNDGATYDDAFVIKTPYRYSQIESLSYSFKESASATAQTGSWTPAATGRFVQDNSIASVGTRAPKFETDGDYLEIVLFDNINYVTIGSEYEFTITFKSPLEAGTSGDGVNWDAREYLHSSYDPFVIVIVDKDNNSEVGDVKRNEMHTPGKQPTTSYGKTEVTNAAMAALTNNYWSVAKVGEDYYPFALDLVSVKDFKVCTEFTLFSQGYTKFIDWSKNPSGYTDWYNYTNDGYLATSLPTQR